MVVFSGRAAIRESVILASTQIGGIKPYAMAGLRRSRNPWEKNNNAPAADPASHTSHSDRHLIDAHAQHGLAAKSRHLFATADAGYPHIGCRFHACACGSKPRLGIPAAARRRDDG